MSPGAVLGCALLAATCGALMARPAHAASLQPVSSWGASGVPTYISMYIYVPDRLASNPPILVVSHYCSGNAAGVFGEAQGGGIVAAADTYGFVMIFPQTSNNCWDVGSTKSLTHNGGGDTQAIAQMVTYALSRYNGNANRVYAVGTSSGAMMTEALLAVYPDVFKAGAEFAGVPAGCWAVSYSPSDQWSGPCAGGQVTHTAQEWGTMVRAMDAGYAGHRPRIQLWHGTADLTINFNNQTEAIKEWTNILGLGATPTSTTTLTLNNHQWTRQSWQSACGFTVLEAWAEQSGPHGTDANLNAMYVIPFLGLDKAGPTDPEIAQCGAGGNGGSGGGGSGGGSGGMSGSGGAGGPGGGAGNGGSSGNGGSQGSGGNPGAVDGGGIAGAPGTGGQAGAAGGSAGRAGNGGAAGTGTSAGVAGSSGAGEAGSGGCSCAFGATPGRGEGGVVVALVLWSFVRRRRGR